MATENTDKVLNGATFEEFAQDCANFIETFKSGDAGVKHHRDALEKAERHLRNVRKMSLARAFNAAAKDYRQTKASLEEDLQRTAENCFRLATVLAKAAAYQPPSEDHVRLKESMIEQLEDTIRCDGDPAYYARELKELRQLTPQEYKAREIKQAQSEIGHHSQELQNAQKIHAEHHRWVAQMRSSLQ